MAFDDDEEDVATLPDEEDQQKSAADYAAIQERLRRKDPGWNMFNNTTPKYSAVYDEGGDKGEADYPNAPIIQGPEPDYAATKQGAEYPFQPPTLAQPQGVPPPIRTFAGNTETTPQQGLGAAYQSLGPVAQEKYRYLMQHRQDILRGTYGPHQAAALTDISRQMADLIHVHEEGEARGAAKALALHPSIANPTGAVPQAPQAAPIFSDRQKQLIGQLQASEQEFKMMANRGEIGEDEIRKGVEYYQQAYKSITPIGMQGEKPNQPGTIKIDQTTGKAYTHDKDGVVQELTNTPTYPSLAHEPSHQAHVTIQKYAELYHTDIATATKIAMAAEMAVKGQPIPPGFLPADLKPAGKEAAGKGPHEEMILSQKDWMDERHKVASRIDARLTRKDASGNVHGDIEPKQREQAVHQEMVSMGLAEHDPNKEGQPDTYTRYREQQTKKLGPQGKPAEAIGAPAQAEPEQAPAPVQDFVSKQIPEAIQKAANKIPFAEVPLNRLRELMQTHPNINTMSPEEKGEYVEGMQVMHQINPRYPEMTPAYIKKIGAIMPAKPYHQREFSKALNEV